MSLQKQKAKPSACRRVLAIGPANCEPRTNSVETEALIFSDSEQNVHQAKINELTPMENKKTIQLGELSLQTHPRRLAILEKDLVALVGNRARHDVPAHLLRP